MMTMGPGGGDFFTTMFEVLLDVVLFKGTLLIGVSWAAGPLLRNTSAARRHAVWAAVAMGLLLAPVVRAAGPVWQTSAQVEVRAPAAERPSANSVAPRVENPVLTPSEPATPELGRTTLAAEPLHPVPRFETTVGTWYEAVVLLWLGGIVLLLAGVALQEIRARRLRTASRPASAGARAAARRAAERLGMQRAPRVLTSETLTVPGALGLVRPCVILPIEAEEWSASRLNAVLLHELSHIQRRDLVTNLLARVVRALYWVNPAIWVVERALARERELACDDRAIVQENAVQYAEHLIRIARSVRGAVPATGGVHFVGRSALGARVRSILDDARSRQPLQGRWMLGLALLTAAVAVPILALNIVAVEQGPGVVQRQIERLQDPDANVRRAGAWALGELEAIQGVQPLSRALGDRDPRVRKMAAWGLGEIKDPASGPALVAALQDRDPTVREMVVLALGELQDPALEDAILGARADESLAAPASWALVESRNADPPPVWAGRLDGARASADQIEVYLTELRHGDADTRALSAERLGRLGTPAAVEALMDALDDPAPAVRAMAVWALDEVNPTRDRAGSRP